MRRVVLAAALAALCGCGANYEWRSHVPADRRLISVPTFRNESGLQEMGAAATRQLLREIQREGSFTVASPDEAKVEVQGVVKSVTAGSVAYNRRTIGRYTGFTMSCEVLITVVDKASGRVIFTDRPYMAETTFASGQDLTTAERDASGRLADELSRLVVDDLLRIDWTGDKDAKGKENAK